MSRWRPCCLVLLTTLASGCRPAVQPPAPRPNILLVTIDTLRADRIGVGLTPTLDALAQRGLRLINARTTAPLTLPAHASIMTGLLPPVHGSRVNGVRGGGLQSPLAARLRQAGYRTGAVVGAFVLDRRFGLAEGFDEYDDNIPRDPNAVDQLQAERRADLVVTRALAWLSDTPRDRPWFLWVHLYDPHAPYNAPTGQAKSVTPAYDGEIAFADAELGRLIKEVGSRPDAERTAILAAGDHGESLGEHGEATHGMLLFEATVRVPLIIAAPGTAPAIRSDSTSLIDVVPTVLALVRQPADQSLPGRDLLQPPDPDRESYSETDYPLAAGWAPGRTLVQERWKLMLSARPKLFDLVADPAETTDLISSRGSVAQAMLRRLQDLSKPVTSAAAAKSVDADTAARLRSLGYIAPSGPALAAPTAARGAEEVIADWVQFEQVLNQPADADALAGYEAVATRHPDGLLFQSSYARALLAAGRTRDAFAAYRRAVVRWPSDGALYHDLAVAARSAGDAAEALRAEQAALVLMPDLPSAHNGLGLLHADADRHREAAQSFQRAVALDPTNASYLVNLANARRANGELDAASEAYRQALDRDATLADAANGLGVVLVQQQRAADAVPLFERAIARDATLVEAQLNLGIALQESGQTARAVAQYRLLERLSSASAAQRQAARTLRQQLEGR
jgi:choline-sulfatase